jgi:hypothetical protein
MEINYKKYSLSELEDVSRNINREKYPDRYEKVVKLIKERYESSEISKNDHQYIEESKGFSSRLGCEKFILYGVYAGSIVFLTSLLFSISGFFFDYENVYFKNLNNPLVFIDVGLVAILTFFLYLKSRLAATLIFIYYSFSKISLFLINYELKVIILPTIFMVVFLLSMIATFFWHKKYKHQ